MRKNYTDLKELINHIAQEIKNTRISKNMTIEELSIKSNISVRYLKSVENARISKISIKSLCKICNALNTNIYNIIVKNRFD